MLENLSCETPRALELTVCSSTCYAGICFQTVLFKPELHNYKIINQHCSKCWIILGLFLFATFIGWFEIPIRWGWYPCAWKWRRIKIYIYYLKHTRTEENKQKVMSNQRSHNPQVSLWEWDANISTRHREVTASTQAWVMKMISGSTL